MGGIRCRPTFTRRLRTTGADTPQQRLRGILDLINACNARNAHAQILDEESADSSTGDRSNYDFCNILSTPDLHGYKTLERF
jgi:hypothetical protein